MNHNVAFQKSIFLVSLVMWLGGCSDSSNTLPPLSIPTGCNPIASSWDCMLPYPSDVFLVSDPSLPSGKRVRLQDNARFMTIDPNPNDSVGPKLADPTDLHPADGFSHLNQIMALFPMGVDTEASNVVFHTDDVTASLVATSPTILLEASTQEPVLHFAELDPMPDSDAERAFFIRPLVRLKNNTRYIVAIHSLKDKDGNTIAAPEGFRRIRDKETKGDSVLDPLATRYESEIFPALASFGLERNKLQLAWDFTTETEENVTHDMLTVRSKVMEYFAQNDPNITITKTTADYNDYIAWRIDATLSVPLFMEEEGPHKLLARDQNGDVVQNGMTEVPFVVMIPNSVVALSDQDTPARVLQFAHGFFGDRDDDPKLISKGLDQNKLIYIAADFSGMAVEDKVFIVNAYISEPDKALLFLDRVHQGMANNLALSYAIQGPLVSVLEALPELQDVGPTPLFDKESLYFYGISQGHILGATFVTLSPHIEKAVLSVGGAGFSFMMYRARPFAAFAELIAQYVGPDLVLQKYSTLTQTAFDRIDPITYAPHTLTDMYEGSPQSRKILIQMGLGDTQVPNLATFLHARVLGIPQLQPTVVDVTGLDSVASPYDGSAVAIYDFGIDPLPSIVAQPESYENEVHNGVRQLDAANAQIDAFFAPDGKIENKCDDVCDPE